MYCWRKVDMTMHACSLAHLVKFLLILTTFCNFMSKKHLEMPSETATEGCSLIGYCEPLHNMP